MKRRKASWISISRDVFFLCQEKSASMGVMSTAESSCGVWRTDTERHTKLILRFLHDAAARVGPGAVRTGAQLVLQVAQGAHEALAGLLREVLPVVVSLLVRPATQKTTRRLAASREQEQLCRIVSEGHVLQVDSVGVQIHADHVRRGVVKVEVARVHPDDKRTGGVEDARQRERAQGDVGTLPLEGEDHLRRDKTTSGSSLR